MRLEELFHDAARLGEPAVPVDVLTRVNQLDRRRRTVAGLVAAACVAALVVIVNVTTGHGHAALPASEVPAGWSQLPTSPLVERRDARAVTVGHEAFYIGGWRYPGCQSFPGAGECVAPGPLTDGAAYDVTTRHWRQISPAPGALGQGDTVVAGSRIYFDRDAAQSLLAYDVPTDTWSEIPHAKALKGRFYPYGLTVAGDHLIACYTGNEGYQDQTYDTAAHAWSALPADPFGAMGNRSCATDGVSLVVLGTAPNEHPSAAAPNFARAALYDFIARTWRRLPDSSVGSSFAGWTWDGSALVNATQDAPYGGPYVGGGRLDLRIGSWSLLPRPPAKVPSGFTNISASGLHFKPYNTYAAPFTAWVWNTQTRRWMTLPPAPRYVTPVGAQTWVGDALVVWGGGTHEQGRGPASYALSSTGGLFQLHTSRTHPRGPATSPQPPTFAAGICPGPQPCTYSTQITTELRLDGVLIRGRSNALQASRTYDLEFRVQLPPGQHVVSYTFGESSGMFGAGPNGLIGIRTLTTGTVLDAQHPLRLSWKPALTGHRYLVLAIELQAPGGRGSGEQTSVGEFQITP